MTSLSNDNQADIIKAFNSTSRYLDDLLYIDNPYFEGIVNQMAMFRVAPLMVYIFLNL